MASAVQKNVRVHEEGLFKVQVSCKHWLRLLIRSLLRQLLACFDCIVGLCAPVWYCFRAVVGGVALRRLDFDFILVHDAWRHSLRALLQADVGWRIAATLLVDLGGAASIFRFLAANAFASLVVRALSAVARAAALRLASGFQADDTCLAHRIGHARSSKASCRHSFQHSRIRWYAKRAKKKSKHGDFARIHRGGLKFYNVR